MRLLGILDGTCTRIWKKKMKCYKNKCKKEVVGSIIRYVKGYGISYFSCSKHIEEHVEEIAKRVRDIGNELINGELKKEFIRPWWKIW